MINYFRTLKLMQWYSILMVIWFTGGRVLALSRTDDTSRYFLAHPLPTLIATLTVFYAIIVFMKYKAIFEEQNISKCIEDMTYILGFAHLSMLLYRGTIFFTYHVNADLGYLIVDMLIFGYFLIVAITCMHTKNNINKDYNQVVSYTK